MRALPGMVSDAADRADESAVRCWPALMMPCRPVRRHPASTIDV